MDRPPLLQSIKRQAPPRAVGDPPSIGRVERLSRGVGSGSKRKSRRDKKDSQRRRRGSRGTSKVARRVTASIFLLTITVIVVTFAYWSNKRQKQSALTEFEKLSKYRPIERIESRFKSPTEGESLAIVTAALESKDEAAVLANFRLGGTEPAEVLEFLRQQEAEQGRWNLSTWIGSVDFNNTLMESVLVKHVKDGEDGFARMAFLTPDDQGVWRLDFESFARKCEPSWETFLSGEATEGVVRVWFSEDNYYNGRFTDDSEWICYSMGRIDSETSLYGYCRRNSPQQIAMVRIMSRLQSAEKNKKALSRATLAISRSQEAEGMQKRQFEIERVLAEEWLLTDTPFDGLPMPLK